MTRIITAICIIAAGILLLLSNLDVLGVRDILSHWWPTLVFGTVAGLTYVSNKKSYLWTLVLLGVGVAVQLSVLGIETNIWTYLWPLLIIILGLSLLKQHATGSHAAPKDQDNVSAFLSGVDQMSSAQLYTGGEVTVVMGGAKLDLRKATFENEATLNVFAVMGGVELWLPENVVVKSRAVCVMAGIEDKTHPVEHKKTPVFYIEGTLLMAGIEIKP